MYGHGFGVKLRTTVRVVSAKEPRKIPTEAIGGGTIRWKRRIAYRLALGLAYRTALLVDVTKRFSIACPH